MITIDDFQKAFEEVQREMRNRENNPIPSTGHANLDAYERGLATGRLLGMIEASRIFFSCIHMPKMKVEYKDTKSQTTEKVYGLVTECNVPNHPPDCNCKGGE